MGQTALGEEGHVAVNEALLRLGRLVQKDYFIHKMLNLASYSPAFAISFRRPQRNPCAAILMQLFK